MPLEAVFLSDYLFFPRSSALLPMALLYDRVIFPLPDLLDSALPIANELRDACHGMADLCQRARLFRQGDGALAWPLKEEDTTLVRSRVGFSEQFRAYIATNRIPVEKYIEKDQTGPVFAAMHSFIASTLLEGGERKAVFWCDDAVISQDEIGRIAGALEVSLRDFAIHRIVAPGLDTRGILEVRRAMQNCPHRATLHAAMRDAARAIRDKSALKNRKERREIIVDALERLKAEYEGFVALVMNSAKAGVIKKDVSGDSLLLMAKSLGPGNIKADIKSPIGEVLVSREENAPLMHPAVLENKALADWQISWQCQLLWFEETARNIIGRQKESRVARLWNWMRRRR